MSDLRDLPDLARDVRERVVTPQYDEVTRRVRARRRRTIGGTLAAAVLVVAGVAVWQSTGTNDSPQPAPSPADESWQSVVAGEMAHPFEVSGTDDGAIAVVWRSLVHPEPTFALVIREADGTVHGRRLDVPVDLTPVPGGWVGVRTAQGFFIGSDGRWQDLGQPGPLRVPRAGDVLVAGQVGQWLYSTTDRSWSLAPRPDGDLQSEVVTAGGLLVACRTEVSGQKTGTRVLTSSAGRHWTDQGFYSGLDTSCLLATNGRYVSAGIRAESGGKIPFEYAVVSDDGGRSWRLATDTWVSHQNSLVLTAGGTTLATSELGELRRLTADGDMDRGDHQQHGVLLLAGDRVYSLPFAQSKGPLAYSDDDGRTWQETTLPGMESSQD